MIEGRVPGRFPDLARRACRDDSPPELARELTERVLVDGRLLDQEGPESEHFYTAANTLSLAGSLDRSAYWLDRAIEISRLRGSVVGFALASAFRAEVAYRMGDLSEAEAHARAAMAFAPGDVTAVLVNTLIERGSVTDATAVLDRHPLDADTDHLLLQPVIAARARLRILQSSPDQAASDLEAVGEWLNRWPILNPSVVSWRSWLAACLQQTGDRERARQLAGEELAHARSLQQAPAIGIALRTAGLIEDHAEGIELLREAVTVLEGSQARLEHAKGLMHLGAALRRAGHRSEAREPLRHALDLAHRCGADPLAQQARTELVATGARPRRYALTGRDALTATERRIADMAATGQTTREIAQSLFITTKTVETHPGHIYQKLDVHSRTNLADALDQA